MRQRLAGKEGPSLVVELTREIILETKKEILFICHEVVANFNDPIFELD